VADREAPAEGRDIMLKTRTETWIAVIVVAIGLFIAGLGGLWVFMSATPPLHRDAKAVTSVPQTDPSLRWADATAQGREIVKARVAEQNLPGVSVAVAVAGEIVWAEGFGWADLDSKVAVTPRTRFRIGTASAALTSAAAGLLVEQGRLKLDERIQAYVPEFPEKEWPVTVRQVMGHVAGVRSDGGDEGPLFGVRCERPVEALAHFADSDLRFEPGSQYRFSNFGWILISAAIEAVANEPFLDFMRTRMFEPLGMTDTRADAGTVPLPDVTSFYFPRFAGDPRYGPDPMRELDYSCYAGASVFLSTPSDMVRFATAIQGGQLLQPATVQQLQTQGRLTNGQGTGYGLGWQLDTAILSGAPTPVVGHDGDSLGGMVSSLLMFPEHGIAVSVMTNISYADTHALAVTLADAFAQHQ